MARVSGGYGTYAFTGRWREDEELASMDNGSGDEYSIVFTAAGAFIRGFDHESPMSPYGDDDYATWPGLVETVPREFAAQLTEPAFCHDGGAGPFLTATVCLWRLHEDPVWRAGDIDFPGETEDPTDRPGCSISWSTGPSRPSATRTVLLQEPARHFSGRGRFSCVRWTALCRDENRDRAGANRSPESFVDGLVFLLKGLTLAR